MKRLFLVILFYLFSQVCSLANERDVRFNQLFNELKVNKAKEAAIVEQEIWTLWSTHPTDEKLLADYKKIIRHNDMITTLCRNHNCYRYCRHS